MNDDTRKPVDPDVAFSYFAGLPPAERSRSRVAARFQVSPQRMSQLAARHRWDDRVALLDARARRRAETTIVRDRAKVLATTLEIVDLAESELLARLRAGEAEVRLADLPGLVRLRELLLGEATERIDVAEDKVVNAAAISVGQRIVEQARRQEYADALEQAVGGIVSLGPTADELEAGGDGR
jgi:hypothetical protein